MENITAVITQEQARISCNFEQVEAAIQDKLAEYKGAVFTEDSKNLAKKCVAGLRADKKTFQDNLRDEKKRYMQPWDEFEARAKVLIAMYDEPINFINGQVQEFEAGRIAKKKEMIGELYIEMVPKSLRKYIPLERIYNKKWENATTKERDIRNEISDAAEKVQKDIATISGMESEAVPRALSLYCASLDLTEALSHINAYERQKQEILAREQERVRREEEERVRREEREKMLAEQRAREEKEAALRRAEMEKQEALRRAEEEKAEALRQAELAREEEARRAMEEKAAAVEQAKAEAAQEVIDSLIPDDGDDTCLYEYRIALSADAKEKLEMFMDSVGIEWEMIS